MRKLRWLVLALIAAAAMYYAAAGFGFVDYVQTWGGAAFKALSGGALGWFINRCVIGLDISALPQEQHPVAALSQALLISAFALALATGV